MWYNDELKKVSEIKKHILLLTAFLHIIIFLVVVSFSTIEANDLAYNLYFTMVIYVCIILGIIRVKHEQIQMHLMLYICAFTLFMQMVAMIYIFWIRCLDNDNFICCCLFFAFIQQYDDAHEIYYIRKTI